MFHAYVQNPNIYIITKEGDNIFCNCKESIYGGAPCRHELSLCISLLKDPNLLYFEPNWRKLYYEIEDDSNSSNQSEEEEEENKEEEKEKDENKDQDQEEGLNPKRVKVHLKEKNNKKVLIINIMF